MDYGRKIQFEYCPEGWKMGHPFFWEIWVLNEFIDLIPIVEDIKRCPQWVDRINTFKMSW